MLSLESLTHPSNVLELTNPTNFLNTMNIIGACYNPGNWCSDDPCSDATLIDVQPSYFSGYVFRGDTRPPDIILKSGFTTQLTKFEMQLTGNEKAQAKKMIGAKRGTTGKFGISTSICASACGHYSFKPSKSSRFSPGDRSGFVYLIDATEFKGFAIPSPRPNASIVVHNPILKDVYEINFPSYIPGNHIVGIVWPFRKKSDEIMACQGYWPPTPARIWLAVNPNYDKLLMPQDKVIKGMEAAQLVLKHFNR